MVFKKCSVCHNLTTDSKCIIYQFHRDRKEVEEPRHCDSFVHIMEIYGIRKYINQSIFLSYFEDFSPKERMSIVIAMILPISIILLGIIIR